MPAASPRSGKLANDGPFTLQQGIVAATEKDGVNAARGLERWKEV